MPDARDIPILHSDEHLLVADKPAGLLVVEAPGRSGPTAVERLGRQLGARVYAVHRLDEDTTGVLVLARTLAAKKALDGMFRAHAIERVYLALVARAPSPAAGTIESRLIEEDGTMRSVVGRGQRAVTHYALRERRIGGALVECRLETGRRNQIRVHLAEIGCPIVGDRKYGWRPRRGERVARPLLHAWRLRLRHPITGVEVVVEAVAPEDELRPPAD
jgi:23S rRNA pseudouridine1911/1915/1917 synthase